jgi:hypothetical protein
MGNLNSWANLSCLHVRLPTGPEQEIEEVIAAYQQFEKAAGNKDYLRPDVSVNRGKVGKIDGVGLWNSVEVVGLPCGVVDKTGDWGLDMRRPVRGAKGSSMGFAIVYIIKFGADDRTNGRGICAALASTINGEVRSMRVQRQGDSERGF